MSESERPPALSPARGRRGGVIALSLVGGWAGAATSFGVEGPGLMLRRIQSRTPGRLEALLSIATDAPLGPRDVEVVVGDRRVRLPAAFEVLAAAYGNGGRGIGSHLI